MKKHPIYIAVFAFLLSGLRAADVEVNAVLAPFQNQTGVVLKVLDADGAIVGRSIDRSRSAAVDPASWLVSWGGGGSTESFVPASLKIAPSSGGAASLLTAILPADLGDADTGEDQWHLRIAGTAASPALVVNLPGGGVKEFVSIDVDLAPFHKAEPKIVARVDPEFTVGGGDDGSIFALSFDYNTGIGLTDDNQIYGLSAQFEGSFTPDPGSSPLVYGRYSGDLRGFRTWSIPRNEMVNGSLYFDLNTHFEADQQTDNYNYTVGAGVWGFLGVKPLTLLSKGLYSGLNLGTKSMTEPPVLTTFLGYDRIVDSEHEDSEIVQGQDRIRFRARYRTPFWRDVDLPVLPTVFDVDGVVDYGGVWDLDRDRALPELKASLEFMPKSIADGKLAFSLSYVSGKISPTFVDEDAFLAGMRLRF